MSTLGWIAVVAVAGALFFWALVAGAAKHRRRGGW